MSIPISDWLHTSNDLLQRLMEKHAAAIPDDQVVAQSTENVRKAENAPALLTPG